MARKLSYSVDDDSNDIVKRYENFLKGEANGYFDVDELESIVEFYLRKGRTKDSKKVIDLGLQLHPQSSILLSKRAKIYLAIGELTKAYRILESLTESSDYEVVLLKIEALLRLKREKEANVLCHATLDGEKDDIDNICLDLAHLYIGEFQILPAIELLEKGLLFNKKNTELLFELAFCRESQLDIDNALKAYHQIIDIDAYNGEAWFNIGQIYFGKQDFKHALIAYDYSVTINEKDSMAWLQKAHAHFQTGEYNDAIEAYREYEKLIPKNWQTSLFIGECYEKLEQFDVAITYYKQSNEIEPSNYDALTGISICLLELEQYNESLAYTRQALEINEEAADAWVYLAEGLIGIDDNENALLAYLKSITIDPGQPDTLMAAANLFMDNGDFKHALEYYTMAYLIDETLEFIDLFMAVAYFKTGNFGSSLSSLQKASHTNADSTGLFFELCPEASYNFLFDGLK